MKKSKKRCMTFFIGAAVLVLSAVSGCKGVDYVKFSNTLPGEYNLAGVSKIALIGFNSLPDNPAAGIYSADEATKRIIEDMIASKFFKGKVYKVTRLDAEKEIFASQAGTIKLAQRFDAILCGRVWWKTSGEYKNIHPVVYNLEKWHYEKYMSGRTSSGQPLYSIARLTDRKTDVKVDHIYRAFNANLMLTLSLYRVNRNGEIEKIVTDFAVADQDYLLDNGKFATTFLSHDAARLSNFERIRAKGENKDAKAAAEEAEKSGELDDNRTAKTIPTELQAKIMLGQKLADAMGKKMTNTEIPVEAEFFTYCFFAPMDKKIFNTIIAGNFKLARKNLVTEIRKAAGYGICDRIGSLSAYDKESVKIANDPKCFEALKKAKNAKEQKEIEEEINELVEDTVDDFENELYALAICEEACGAYEYALETYRALLKSSAEEKYALGISRCLASLDMTDRLTEIAKEAKKSTKKSSLK